MEIDIDFLRASIAQKYNALVEDITLNQYKRVDGIMVEMPLEEMQKSISALQADIRMLLCLENKEAGIAPVPDRKLLQLRPSTLISGLSRVSSIHVNAAGAFVGTR